MDRQRLYGFIARHEKALCRFFLVLSIAFFALGIVLLLPFVGNAVVSIGSMLKGSQLRRPDKWISLLHRGAALSFLVAVLFLGLRYACDHLQLLSDFLQRHRLHIQNLLLFLVLFVLLVMHAPEDFFTPYLWAEDGAVLIGGAIANGIGNLLTVHGGALWMGQKLLGLVCYWLVWPFNDIAALPYIQQTFAKLLATASVFYFVSDRFAWLLREKFLRFAVCVMLVVLIFPGAVDVVTCETSLPVYFIFTVFLVGLDLLFNPKTLEISWKQVAFLVVFALSWAAAPFAIIVAGLSFLRYLVCSLRGGALHRKGLLVVLVKTFIVGLAVLIQLIVILRHGRCSSDFDLLHRFILNTKAFFFLPQKVFPSSWLPFITGLLCWALFWKFGKLPLPVMGYAGLFSWGVLLLSSMLSSPDYFFFSEGGPRYFFASFEIAMFILVLASLKMATGGNRLAGCIAVLILLMLPITGSRSYRIGVVGAEFADTYRRHSFVFDRKGQNTVYIPIGPWNCWVLTVPASIESASFADDLEFSVEAINGNVKGTKEYGVLDFNLNDWKTTNVAGFARTPEDGQVFTSLFMKNPVNGSFMAASKIHLFNTPPHVLSAWGESRCSGFEFNLIPDYFCGQLTELELYGRAEDGSWHRGKLLLPLSQ